MGKGFSQCIPYVVIIYFSSFNLFPCSPLPLYSQPPIIQQLSRYNLISSTFTDVIFIILLMLYPSLFLSFFPWVHYYKHVLHMHLHIIMLFLWICLSSVSVFHVWEKICCLCLSESVLLYLTWCPSIASIYIQTTCHYSYGWVKFHYLFIPHFLFFFILV
jgi:hypothetical protein